MYRKRKKYMNIKTLMMSTVLIVAASTALFLAVEARNLTAEVESQDWDVNDDGYCNLLDVNLVAYHIGSGDLSYDVNGDGVVDQYDVQLVESHCDWRNIGSGSGRADTDVYVDPSSQTVAAARTFTVDIECTPGEDIRAFQFSLSFNKDLLEAVSVSNVGEIFINDGHTIFFGTGDIDNGAGTITNVYATIEGAYYTNVPGRFATITFTAKESNGLSSLDLQDVQVTNLAGPVSITVTDGGATVFANIQNTDTLEYFLTIQAANDDSDTLDTHHIAVADGVYTEQVTLTKGLTITGASEANTIIQADTSQTGSGHVFSTGTGTCTGKDITFEKMTIRYGDYGIRTTSGNVDVLNCTFYNNGCDGTPIPVSPTPANMLTWWTDHCTDGGAIRIQDSVGSEIDNVTAHDNDRGIRYQDGTGGHIHNCDSYDNAESGIYLSSSSYTSADGCTDTLVENCKSYGNMNNGLLSIGGKTNTFRNNEAYDNWNTGVMLWHVGENLIENNDIINNNLYNFNGQGVPGDDEGGVWVVNTGIYTGSTYVCKITCNKIDNNQVGGLTEKVGIHIDSTMVSDGIEITNNIFTSHDTDIWVESEADTTTVNYNSFSAPTAVDNDDTDTLDASVNWYGVNTPAGVVAAVEGNVDYTPWLDVGTNLGSSPCFEPDLSYLHVDDCLQTGSKGRIQEAVDEVSGSTVKVHAGTYAEGIIIIDKAVTIIGVTTPSKPIITPTTDTGLDNVIGASGRGWFQIHGGADVTFQNLVFDGAGKNIRTAIHYHADSVGGEVKNCDIKNIGHISQYHGRGINNYGQHVDVLDCTFENIQRIGVFTFNPTATTLIDDCSYTGKGAGGDWLDYGLEAGNGGAITVEQSTIIDCTGVALSDGSTSAGILVTTYFGPGTQATITYSDLLGNTEGIGVGYDASDTSIVVAHSNNIVGNGMGVGSTAPTVDATCNWWGSVNGPTHASNVFNVGSQGDSASDNVDFCGWLDDSYLSGTCWGPVKNFDTGEFFCSIQAAIDDPETLDTHTIELATGVFSEGPQIHLNKDLTIDGQGCVNTIIKPTANTGSSGDARGWFLVDDATGFNLLDVELDGTGFDIYQAIRHKGYGTIQLVCFKEIKYPGYGGVAIAAFGSSGSVNTFDCTFEEIGRVGILQWISGTISGNTYTGKDVGDWLDYFVDTQGAVVTIDNNYMIYCTGVALSDGSTSAGILVTTYNIAGADVTITNNDILACTTGIAVGYDDTDTSTVVANYNNLVGNDYGVDSTAPSVDAECNWWGHADGPTHSSNPTGTGDDASDYVDFRPWWTAYDGPCDTTDPVITSIVLTSSSPLDTDPAFGWITITCTVNDAVGVDEVNLVIDGSTIVTMSRIGVTNEYDCDASTSFSVGPHSYYVSAEDLSGNIADTSGSPNTFDMPANYDIDASLAIDILDINMVVLIFGDSCTAGSMREDVDNNGIIDIMDLQTVAYYFGTTWP